MMLWLILTAITAAAAVYVAAPFLRPYDKTAGEPSSALGIFRDQLSEIDREVASGAIEPSAAEQARAEVKRRMLAADRAAGAARPASPLTPLEYKFVLLVISTLTVIGSALLYAFNGSPNLPSAVPGVSAPVVQDSAQGGGAANGGAPTMSDVDTMIGKLVDRLKANPNDVRGWAMLGWSYMSTGKFDKAVEAYRKAVEVDAKSASARVGLADALIQSAGGKVTPEASVSIGEALAIDPKEPRAVFLRGLGKSQAGDAKGAIDDWIVVLGLAQPNDPWVPEVRQQIVELAKQANIDVSGRLPAAAAGAPAQSSAPAATSDAGAAPGPSADQVAAAQNMSETDRTAMIKGMVEKLAQKLEANPRNVEGWIQLMRSRKVLGDADGAKAALKRSLEVFADSTPDQDKLKATGTELGLQL